MDTEAVAFLRRCAERTDTTWRIPVAVVARSALAGLDGLVLRWLVDPDTDALITGLDDLTAMITVNAIASPTDATEAVRPGRGFPRRLAAVAGRRFDEPARNPVMELARLGSWLWRTGRMR